jgi:hypothetical protein
MKRFFGFLAAIIGITAAQAANIGQWNAYLAYHDITDIEPAGQLIYVLSSNDLFSYNVNDKSVYAYNKTNSISDTEINYIAWNPSAKKLIIIYSNYNIDLLDNNFNVENISDYYSKAMTDDKTVNNVTINGNNAFISTGFGIIKLNMRDAEISETYNLGKNVIDCSVSGNIIFAKTSDGIYQGNTIHNLVDPNNWTLTTQSVSFSDANDITVSTTNGYTEYIAYDATNKCYWSNQQNGCLQGWTQGDSGERTIIASEINADGPKYNYFGFMKFTQGNLYSCGGGWSYTNDRFRPGALQQYDGNKWIKYEDDIKTKTESEYIDLMCLDVHPNNANIVYACGRTGLYEFNDGKFVKYYNKDNSPLFSLLNTNNYLMTFSCIFDRNNNLWCFNSGVNKENEVNAAHKLFNNTWTSYHNDNLTEGNKNTLRNMLNPILDHESNIWFVNNHWGYPALCTFNPTNTESKIYSSFVNQDGITISPTSVYCTAEDKNYNIWICTNLGPLYISYTSIKNDDLTFQQYKVPRNDGTNLADYLLSGIDISCMAVDAANRKWFGTNGNGVYLISADNNTEEQHFLASNSYLLSDNVESIAINEQSGEVFFGTDKGLCSYMSDATITNEEMSKDNVWAYPNPVRPEYNGLITITGLSYNADVKICTSNGVLVNEGRSTGGSYIWNGCDKDGKRVASGVYMVQTAKSDGSKGTVCKIAIVR